MRNFFHRCFLNNINRAEERRVGKECTVTERNEVQELTAHAMKVLRKVSNAVGFNIGINQGAVAGAGIAGHLHQHVVPRWGGDANFMPIIGKTKVLPKLLQESRQQLAAAWDQI